MTTEPIKLFISYSHDSSEHDREVLLLSERLRVNGIDACIDQYAPYPKEGWPRWMERRIAEADRVAMVCTPTYRRRVEGDEEPGIGKGVCWEANLIYNDLYQTRQTTAKYIPILLAGGSEDDVPRALQGHSFHRVHTDEGYWDFYRRLTDQPPVRPGPLGDAQRLPSLTPIPEPRLDTATPPEQARKFFISYSRGDPNDENLARFLHSELTASGHQAFIDISMRAGSNWVQAILERIEWCDRLVVLLSERSMRSEMMVQEVRLAHQQSERYGHPIILPVRVGYFGRLEYELHHYLGNTQYVGWQDDGDSRRVLNAVLAGAGTDDENDAPATEDASGAEAEERRHPASARDTREAIVPDRPIGVNDPYYLEREQDRVVLDLAERDSQTLVIKGPHQTGKSSLLLGYLSRAREAGKQLAFVDFKIFSQADLSSYPSLLTRFAQILVRRLRLDIQLPAIDSQFAMFNFMETALLPALQGPTVLAFDDADRILGQPYQLDFFTMLRAWHEYINSPLQPDWEGLDLALVISTEPYLLIPTSHRSPFTVGRRIETHAFDADECRALDSRYSGVLEGEQQERLWRLLRGHPYLTRLAYYRLTAPDRIGIEQLEECAHLDDGPFGDHLRSLLVRLHETSGSEHDLLSAMKQAIRTGAVVDKDAYYRLYGAGLVTRNEERIDPANLLYARYFRSAL